MAIAAASFALAVVGYRWLSITSSTDAQGVDTPAEIAAPPLPAGSPLRSSHRDESQPERTPTVDWKPVALDQGLIPDVRAALDQTSLRGTAPDGGLSFGEDGQLIVNADLRHHLDWWLTLLGEMPLARIRTLLLDNLINLDPGQAAQVIAFFDRWTEYLQAADALAPATDTGQRLAQLSALRRQWFGADAQTLFADEERYIEATLARQSALSDPTLTPTQRDAALRSADQMLTPEQRQTRQASRDPMLASEQTAQLDAIGASAEQRHQERAAIWGEDAAQRLAALDQERALWQARVEGFRSERQQILANESLSAEQQAEQIQELLNRDFQPAEARRALALAELADHQR